MPYIFIDEFLICTLNEALVVPVVLELYRLSSGVFDYLMMPYQNFIKNKI
jgi:hypothetical protein